jgi:putative endonuclease
MKTYLPLNLCSSGDDSSTAALGRRGEELALQFLINRGLRLVMTNFKVPIGRNSQGAAVTGEIDLIMLDEETICFVEVKTRSSDDFASPLDAVDRRKQRQIIRAARVYRKLFNLRDAKVRYDAVSVVIRKTGRPEIEHFPAFWNEAKFRKRIWRDETYAA